MDIEQIYHNNKNMRARKTFFTVCLLIVWLFVFAGVVSAKDTRIPPTPPIVLSHTPELNAAQVSVNGVVSVVWDRPMKPDTTFTVTGPEGFLNGAFQYDPDSYTVTFLPDENLLPATRYGVLVAGQSDIVGQVQQEVYQWNFTSVSPTSVSLISFDSADDSLGESWWWLSWPALMAVVSMLSLGGFFVIWSRRRSVV